MFCEFLPLVSLCGHTQEGFHVFFGLVDLFSFLSRRLAESDVWFCMVLTQRHRTEATVPVLLCESLEMLHSVRPVILDWWEFCFVLFLHNY